MVLVKNSQLLHGSTSLAVFGRGPCIFSTITSTSSFSSKGNGAGQGSQMLSAPVGTQTWVHSVLWGLQFHQIAHASICGQLNLEAPGTCDCSKDILAAHR